MNTFFINGKPPVINGLTKLRNPPFWIVVFLVVPFNKFLLYSKDLTTFTRSYIPFFVSVMPELLDSFIDIFLILITACIILTSEILLAKSCTFLQHIHC